MVLFKNFVLPIVLLLIFSKPNSSETSFETRFRDCNKADLEFDDCIKNALNDVQLFFKTGVPEWKLPPFDPFFAKDVVQNIGIPSLNYNLKLINATEAGWTESKVTTFKSDLENNLIRYTQYFPAKFLKGMYQFNGNILGTRIVTAGYWNLDLYGFIQTTTVTRKPRILDDGSYAYDTPLKVKVNIQSTKNMTLHISNLLGGHQLLEVLLDRIINFTWPPGFVILAPLINDLVSSAFTDIFNQAFQYFPFDKLVH